MLTYKALGALLTYPEEDLIAGLDEVMAVLKREGLLDAAHLAALQALADDLKAADLIDAQERYVSLFDRSRTLSLHLYEHVHGEGRERGTAMATLVDLYRFHGFDMAARELPDYLPLLCEFLSLVDDAVARRVIADAVSVLAALSRRLTERETPYAAVLQALVHLSAKAADAAEVEAILASTPKDADSLEELDKVWEDAPVTFGPGDALASCPMVKNPLPSRERVAAAAAG